MGYIWGVCLSTSVLRRQTYTAQGAHPRTVLAMESSFITPGSSGPMTCCCLGRAPRQTHDGPGGVRHPRYGTARPSDPQVKAVPAYAGRASLSGEFPPSGRGVTAYRFALQSGIVLRIDPGMQGCDGGETVVTSRPPNKARFIYRRHCQLHIEVADGITTRRGRLDEHAQTGPWQTCEVWPRPRIYAGALVSLKRHSALSLPPPLAHPRIPCVCWCRLCPPCRDAKVPRPSLSSAACLALATAASIPAAIDASRHGSWGVLCHLPRPRDT